MFANNNSKKTPVEIVIEQLSLHFHEAYKYENGEKNKENHRVKFIRDNALYKLTDEKIISIALNGKRHEKKEEDLHKVHSSAMFNFNCFYPFHANPQKLTIPLNSQSDTTKFTCLKFEKCCRSKLGGAPPQLDTVLISRNSGKNDEVIAIESKLTEYFTSRKPKFVKKYRGLPREGYYDEMIRILDSEEKFYNYLDAAQLIKHSFGLVNFYRNKDVSLIYLYWEPQNIDSIDLKLKEIILAHRSEIEHFKNNTRNCKPKFIPMNFNKLWSVWNQSNEPSIQNHSRLLQNRYFVNVEKY